MDQEAVVGQIDLPTGPRLAFVTIGPSSVTPVLLLHAWGECCGSFDRLLRLLPDTVHAVAFDQRGHGRTQVPQIGYSVAEFAGDVVAVMDALGLSSVVLLGSSSGGYVAQQVAVTNPDRVAGLVLVGSPRSLQGRPSFADEVDQLSDPVDPAWVRTSLTWFPRFHEVPEWYIEDRVEDGARIPANVWRETFDGLCNARPPTDVGTVSAATLIIWGERDELLSRDQEEDLARAIPRSRLVVYDDTGHLVLWEQPERVARDLTAFVESLPHNLLAERPTDPSGRVIPPRSGRLGAIENWVALSLAVAHEVRGGPGVGVGQERRHRPATSRKISVRVGGEVPVEASGATLARNVRGGASGGLTGSEPLQE